MAVLHSIMAFGVVGLAAGVLLVIAYGKLKVEDDPKVEKILNVLPGINCGVCGYASCHEYAVSCAKDAAINLCRAGGNELAENIAAILGVEHQELLKLKAVVLCNVRERKYFASYSGPPTCASANLTSSGMACKYGCFGFDDCVVVCPFDALHLNKNNIPVVDIIKCTGCGKCVDACPRGIIVLREIQDDRIVYVGCSNKQSAKNTKKVCDVGCIACNICVKRAPEGAFIIQDNLSGVKRQADINIDEIKCPTGCIYEM